MKGLSPTAISIITLLNNINDLIIQSSNRTEAIDVMKALVLYAKEKRYLLPIDLIEQFYAIILDSRPITLSFLLRKITKEIIKNDKF